MSKQNTLKTLRALSMSTNKLKWYDWDGESDELRVYDYIWSLLLFNWSIFRVVVYEKTHD